MSFLRKIFVDVIDVSSFIVLFNFDKKSCWKKELCKASLPLNLSQSAITCSKLTKEALEVSVNYVES